MEQKKTAYKKNPSFGQGFSDERFGEGSIKITITEENLDSLVKNVQVGSTLLVRFNRETKFGNKHYFCDILPPYNGEKKSTRKATSGDLD